LYRQLKTGVGFRVIFQSGKGLLRRKGLKNADLAHQLALNVTALCDAMQGARGDISSKDDSKQLV
jgi:hypothetical protein